MAAPTVEAYAESTWPNSDNVDEQVTLSWQASDDIYVMGGTDNNTVSLGTPTESSGTLTFSAVSGFPTNTTDTCKLYAWKATAPSSQTSQTITCADNNAEATGISAWVVRGSSGTGNTSVAANNGATTTRSLTRSGANSIVLGVLCDWNAVNDTAVTAEPSASSTIRENSFTSGRYTAFVLDWGDQGSAGTTSYGFTGHAGGGKFAVGLIEVLGSGDTPVSRTWDVEYNIANSVSRTWDVEYSILNAISRTWDVEYSILNAISRTWDVEYSILNAVSREWVISYDLGDVVLTLVVEMVASSRGCIWQPDQYTIGRRR